MRILLVAAALALPAVALRVDTLYDLPVSNHGARCRIVLREKGIGPDRVKIAPPSELGGLKSEEYTALHPQGKMPLLVTGDGLAIPESNAICRYLLAEFPEGPSFIPAGKEALYTMESILEIHSSYISNAQGALYKGGTAVFHAAHTRGGALGALVRDFACVETMATKHGLGGGRFLLGDEVTLADAALFPTCVFLDEIGRKVYGFKREELMGPHLSAWYDRLLADEPSFTEVHAEISTVLASWQERGRYASFVGAGLRDEAPATVFDKIIEGSIPADVLYEDDVVMAFRDINPQAPFHALVVPKQRLGLTQLRKAEPDHEKQLGRLMATAAKIAAEQDYKGFRFIVNDGREGGQEVFHLHMHVLGFNDKSELKFGQEQ